MNVLVVMSDQHNGRAMGCAGHPFVRTPNMDALAAEGTRFSAAYTNSPICVPARAAWATGRYVHETGCWDNATAYEGEPPGWGHALQAAGVRVESIGKLHYRDATAPTGFDRQLNPMHLAGGIGQVWGSIRDPLPRRKGAHLLVAWSGAGETDYTRYDRRSTELACEWLTERGRTPGEPWVLYVGLVAPHHPFIAPDGFFSLYDQSSMPRAKLHPLDGYERHPWVAAYSECSSASTRATPTRSGSGARRRTTGSSRSSTTTSGGSSTRSTAPACATTRSSCTRPTTARPSGAAACGASRCCTRRRPGSR